MARLATAFFCSGFGALLCQVVWQRMLGMVLLQTSGVSGAG